MCSGAGIFHVCGLHVTENRFKSCGRESNDDVLTVEFHDGKSQPNQLTVNPDPA
jgi:hypothetical protein